MQDLHFMLIKGILKEMVEIHPTPYEKGMMRYGNIGKNTRNCK